MKPSFTIGIEEEYQTIDPETRDLRSHIGLEIIEKGKAVLKEAVKPEMHQSVVEVGTGICRNIQEARRKSASSAHQIIRLARKTACAWPRPPPIRSPTGANRRSIPTSATATIVEDMKMVARANLIFGLHVHVGIEDREDRHPHHECGALLPAAYPGAFHQFAFLAGHGYRAEILPLQSLR
jgi:carboxylate-amine ligase